MGVGNRRLASGLAAYSSCMVTSRDDTNLRGVQRRTNTEASAVST